MVEKSKRDMLRRCGAYLARKMLSSVTNEPFPPGAQKVLYAEYMEKGYTSPYWFTFAQCKRSLNAKLRDGASPVKVTLAVEAVLPFALLPEKVQQEVLDQKPPYFSAGVGILSHRYKWNVVLAKRLTQKLNPNDDERAFFVDVDFVRETLKIPFDKAASIDITAQSSVLVYNADQLEDPYRGVPARGMALGAVSGKRLPQPAHDILLAAGILRGYKSPFWITEPQLPRLNLTMTDGIASSAICVSTLHGTAVPLRQLLRYAPNAANSLIAELKASHHLADQHGMWLVYGANGWEAIKSTVLAVQFAKVTEAQGPTNAADQGTLFAVLEDICSRRLDLRDEVEAAMKNAPLISSGVDLSEATKRKYYNADVFPRPELVFPSFRPIAVINGKLVDRRVEGQLRQRALKNGYSSPIWLTKLGAKELGVDICEGSGVVLSAKQSFSAPCSQFYNIDDFVNKEALLEYRPVHGQRNTNAHLMLDGKWKAVLGLRQRRFLDSLKRKSKLWVSASEALMSGYKVRPGRRPHDVNEYLSSKKSKVKKNAAKKGDTENDPNGDVGRVVYNSQQTTDPVRVLALSHLFTRPQAKGI